MPRLKHFTIVGIYPENDQRYCTSAFRVNATEAVIAAFEACRRDNKEDDMELNVCAVFRGQHSAADTFKADAGASERPDPVRCRAKKDHRFTVVNDGDVNHVMDRNAVEAELGFHGAVAGVFRGHLADVSNDVEWDIVEARTTVAEAA